MTSIFGGSAAYSAEAIGQIAASLDMTHDPIIPDGAAAKAGSPKTMPKWQRRSRLIMSCRSVSAIHLVAALVLFTARAHGAEVMPPKPDRYFNDYAGIVSKEAGTRFNEQLAQFERETSDQVVVAIFPKMQSDSDIADYTQRIAQAWGIGQKDRRNGVVLFVFIQDRKMFIQVGYGLEGALPDITAFDITEYHIKPLFRNGNYAGGLASGIDLICKAIRGEYKGSGKTVAERRAASSGGSGLVAFVIFIIALIVISRVLRRLGGYGYSSGRGGPIFFPVGVGGGGSSSGGGGGFGGFSGGGGSFGGGGAGSSW